MLKIKGTEVQQALTELMVDAIGPLAAPFDVPFLDGQREHSIAGDDDAAPLAAYYFIPEDVDLRRFERDPEEHHRADDSGAVIRERRQPWISALPMSSSSLPTRCAVISASNTASKRARQSCAAMRVCRTRNGARSPNWG